MIPLTTILEYGTIKSDVEIIKADPLKLHDFASLCLRFVLLFRLYFIYCSNTAVLFVSRPPGVPWYLDTLV